MLQRHAVTNWLGSLVSGGGTVSTESGALDECLFGFRTRFENDPGTNPEELIGAAHASCYSMRLSDLMAKTGCEPERLDVRATVTLARDREFGGSITASHLSVAVKASGLTKARLQELADDAVRTCPVSRALNLAITIEVVLG